MAAYTYVFFLGTQQAERELKAAGFSAEKTSSHKITTDCPPEAFKDTVTEYRREEIPMWTIPQSKAADYTGIKDMFRRIYGNRSPKILLEVEDMDWKNPLAGHEAEIDTDYRNYMTFCKKTGAEPGKKLIIYTKVSDIL